jgi:hypothetical protein
MLFSIKNKMNQIKEIENFLPIEHFKKIQQSIFDLDFPWRIRNYMTTADNNIYFTHSFFNDGGVNSDFYYNSLIKPILNKLNYKAVIEVRANMNLNKLFDKSGWHTDREWNNTTAILYLNNCNGGTELKLNNEIKFVKSKENKILIFPANTQHRGCTSNDCDRRYFINFNYF